MDAETNLANQRDDLLVAPFDLVFHQHATKEEKEFQGSGLGGGHHQERLLL